MHTNKIYILCSIIIAGCLIYTDASATKYQEFPDRAVADTWSIQKSFQEWKAILPTGSIESDRYIVYPKSGIITPILFPTINDQLRIKNNESFAYKEYLEKGALQYIWPQPGHTGNSVIAGHSAFESDIYSPYYTTFQAVNYAGTGDTIKIYHMSGGALETQSYTITKSYETDPENSEPVIRTTDTPSITTYTCSPIGDNTKRWVNHATLQTQSTEFLAPTTKLHEAAGITQPRTLSVIYKPKKSPKIQSSASFYTVMHQKTITKESLYTLSLRKNHSPYTKRLWNKILLQIKMKKKSVL
jgi:LPXTG-site transpeptidase (sortase) family protein